MHQQCDAICISTGKRCKRWADYGIKGIEGRFCQDHKMCIMRRAKRLGFYK